jgi:hypothetical protein
METIGCRWCDYEANDRDDLWDHAECEHPEDLREAISRPPAGTHHAILVHRGRLQPHVIHDDE